MVHAVGTDVSLGFVASPEYKDYLKKEKMGDPTKAAKLLGIKDVKKLTRAMEEAAMGNKKEAEKLLAELAKSEKLAAKAADMMKALKNPGSSNQISQVFTTNSPIAITPWAFKLRLTRRSSPGRWGTVLKARLRTIASEQLASPLLRNSEVPEGTTEISPAFPTLGT